MINDNEHHQASHSRSERDATTPTLLGLPSLHETSTPPKFPAEKPHVRENVRATLSPLLAPHAGRANLSDVSPRSSVDLNRKSWDVRRSMDASRTFRRPSYETRRPSHEIRRPSHEIRRSFSGSRYDRQRGTQPGDRSPLSPRVPDSASATLSLEPGTESSAAIQSMDESSASASQILNRSDVFRAPEMQSTESSPSRKIEASTRHSQDTTRSSGNGRPLVKPLAPVKQGNNPPVQIGTHDVEDDIDATQAHPRLSGSSSALQDIASYPYQKASGLAGFLRTRSKKMGNLLASESMGYYEKVSGMLAGGRKHYNTAEGLEPHDQVHGFEDDEDAAKAAENFREHFAFHDTEVLQSSFFASLQRVLPNYGKIYISGRYFCFRSLMPTSKTKVSLAFSVRTFVQMLTSEDHPANEGH